VRGLVPLRVLRSARAVPLARETRHGRATLVVAMTDPEDVGAVDELAFACGMPIRAVRAEEREVLRALGLSPESDVPGLGPIDLGLGDALSAEAADWVVPVAERP